MPGDQPTGPFPLPRARVVGGSSTINAAWWLRGSAADYDGWAAEGNPGWGFVDLLPYFRRSEADPLGGRCMALTVLFPCSGRRRQT